MTDNEVTTAMLIAARTPSDKGHEPAKRIIERNHFKLLYAGNPEDFRIRPDALDRLFSAAKQEFGVGNVMKSEYTEKGGAQDFPVKLKDGRRKKSPGPDARARRKELVTHAKDLIVHLGEYAPEAVQVWIDGLSATKWEYDPTTKTRFEVPDWRERRENAAMIFAYAIGRPLERSMEVTGSYKELGEVLAELEKSPEARRLLSPELFATLRQASAKEVAQQLHEGKDISDSEQNPG
jgi:hypothetical protein